MNGSEINIKAQLNWHYRSFKLPLSGSNDYDTLIIIIKNLFNLNDNSAFLIEYSTDNGYKSMSSQTELWQAIDSCLLNNTMSIFITIYDEGSILPKVPKIEKNVKEVDTTLLTNNNTNDNSTSLTTNNDTTNNAFYPTSNEVKNNEIETTTTLEKVGFEKSENNTNELKDKSESVNTEFSDSNNLNVTATISNNNDFNVSSSSSNEKGKEKMNSETEDSTKEKNNNNSNSEKDELTKLIESFDFKEFFNTFGEQTEKAFNQIIEQIKKSNINNEIAQLFVKYFNYENINKETDEFKNNMKKAFNVIGTEIKSVVMKIINYIEENNEKRKREMDNKTPPQQDKESKKENTTNSSNTNSNDDGIEDLKEYIKAVLTTVNLELKLGILKFLSFMEELTQEKKNNNDSSNKKETNPKNTTEAPYYFDDDTDFIPNDKEPNSTSSKNNSRNEEASSKGKSPFNNVNENCFDFFNGLQPFIQSLTGGNSSNNLNAREGKPINFDQISKSLMNGFREAMTSLNNSSKYVDDVFSSVSNMENDLPVVHTEKEKEEKPKSESESGVKAKKEKQENKNDNQENNLDIANPKVDVKQNIDINSSENTTPMSNTIENAVMEDAIAVNDVEKKIPEMMETTEHKSFIYQNPCTSHKRPDVIDERNVEVSTPITKTEEKDNEKVPLLIPKDSKESNMSIPNEYEDVPYQNETNTVTDIPKEYEDVPCQNETNTVTDISKEYEDVPYQKMTSMAIPKEYEDVSYQDITNKETDLTKEKDDQTTEILFKPDPSDSINVVDEYEGLEDNSKIINCDDLEDLEDLERLRKEMQLTDEDGLSYETKPYNHTANNAILEDVVKVLDPFISVAEASKVEPLWTKNVKGKNKEEEENNLIDLDDGGHETKDMVESRPNSNEESTSFGKKESYSLMNDDHYQELSSSSSTSTTSLPLPLIPMNKKVEKKEEENEKEKASTTNEVSTQPQLLQPSNPPKEDHSSSPFDMVGERSSDIVSPVPSGSENFETFEFDVFDDPELEKLIKKKNEENDLLDEYEII